MEIAEIEEGVNFSGAEDAERLSSWFVGEGAELQPLAHAVLVQPGGDVAALVQSDLLAPGATVFADASPSLAEETGVRFVAVEGGAEHAGDELIISGSLYVQVFDYGSLAYLSVAGPTVVRMTCTEDYEAFLEDADRAVQEGVWAEALGHPSVQLADLDALASPLRAVGLGRLYLTAEGRLRTSVGGQDLGHVSAGAETVRAAAQAFGGDPSLGAVVPAPLLRSGAAERPWLRRYLHALEVKRRLVEKFGPDMRISGFGGRFTSGLVALPVEAADRPLLVEAQGEIFAVRTDDFRLFRLGRGSACLFEVFSALCTEDTAESRGRAAAVAGPLLGITAEEALRAYADVEAKMCLTTAADRAAGGTV
ncbi:daptide biosynthesis RiPP recognition protein [Streptomyces sp. NPDC006463]|uniref:daptide biosynthesis RiPP recognition protein n=1 Tax=Streptomyces sp. NPDC006463 TaxID=3364746 RepID=UPI0036AE0923